MLEMNEEDKTFIPISDTHPVSLYLISWGHVSLESPCCSSPLLLNLCSCHSTPHQAHQQLGARGKNLMAKPAAKSLGCPGEHEEISGSELRTKTWPLLSAPLCILASRSHWDQWLTELNWTCTKMAKQIQDSTTILCHGQISELQSKFFPCL